MPHRRDTYDQAGNHLERVEVYRLADNSVHVLVERPPGTVVEDRLALPEEREVLEDEEARLADQADWEWLEAQVDSLPLQPPFTEFLRRLHNVVKRGRR